ncbi:MAG: divalent-cation tolerance protein CutA [Candidatus Accumulibacter sp.]|jgi:periplasmic divalent cation tolerance protein|nr:divalent-cation tolerance protein CutA [Accumulibacter sp.]
MNTLLVLTNLPDRACAEKIADSLVSHRHAACVNIFSPCRSIYRWKGVVESADEVPLFIKTTSSAYPALEAALRAAHPYETPEIVAIPVERGLPEYLDWVASETRSDAAP